MDADDVARGKSSAAEAEAEAACGVDVLPPLPPSAPPDGPALRAGAASVAGVVGLLGFTGGCALVGAAVGAAAAAAAGGLAAAGAIWTGELPGLLAEATAAAAGRGELALLAWLLVVGLVWGGVGVSMEPSCEGGADRAPSV